MNEGHVEAAQKERGESKKERRKKKETQPALEWMFVSPQNSYIEALIPMQ